MPKIVKTHACQANGYFFGFRMARIANVALSRFRFLREAAILASGTMATCASLSALPSFLYVTDGLEIDGFFGSAAGEILQPILFFHQIDVDFCPVVTRQYANVVPRFN